MPPFWWGGIFTRNRYLSRTKLNAGRAFSGSCSSRPFPHGTGATSFCARQQRTIPSREATNKGHQRKGTLQHSQSVFDRLRGALRNLPTMSRLNRTENRHFSRVESNHGSERSIPTSRRYRSFCKCNDDHRSSGFCADIVVSAGRSRLVFPAIRAAGTAAERAEQRRNAGGAAPSGGFVS